jgi:hypothetical protein
MKETLSIRELIEEAVTESIDYRLQGLQESLSARVMIAVDALMKEQQSSEDSSEKVNSAVIAIQAVSSQVDVLKSLLEGATHFSSRIALFILRGQLAIGWQAQGFEKNETIKTVSLDLGSGLLKIVMDSHAPAKVLIEAFDPKFVSVMNGFPEGECIVVPLIVRGKVAALLYADSGTEGAEINQCALELIARAAGDWIELQALRKAAGTPQHYPGPVQTDPAHQEPPQTHVAPGATDHNPAPAVAPEAPAVAAPVSSVPVPESSYVEPPHAVEAAPTAPVPAPTFETVQAAPPHVVEAVPKYTVEPAPVRAVEPVPAAPVDNVRAHTVETVATPAPQPAPIPAPAVQAHALSDEELELHKKARRFAKLLVDEIVLYNRAAVTAGRQNHDLYDRLREPIEKSRASFDKRYANTSVAQSDYFNEALIAVLAAHNHAALGGNFRR